MGTLTLYSKMRTSVYKTPPRGRGGLESFDTRGHVKSLLKAKDMTTGQVSILDREVYLGEKALGDADIGPWKNAERELSKGKLYMETRKKSTYVQ